MACNSSSLSPSRALLLFVAIIRLASCLQVCCVQNESLLQDLNNENLTRDEVEEMLNAVEDKDQVELGDYNVKDILAIADQDSLENCLGDSVSNYRIAVDYYANNHGLFKFYLEYYYTLVHRCVSSHSLVLDAILVRLTNTDLKNLITFEKELPDKFMLMFKGSVSRAVSSYMSATMGNRTISNNHLELGLREELETSCKRLLKGSSSFAEFRNVKQWYTHHNEDTLKWNRISRGCEIFLDNFAPSVLNQ